MSELPEELPTPRLAMLQAVQCATLGMNEAAITWVRIAAELRAGWTPLAYDVAAAPADRIFGYTRGQEEPPTWQQSSDAREHVKWLSGRKGQPRMVAEAEWQLLAEIIDRYDRAVAESKSVAERATMFEAVIRTDEARAAYAEAARDHQAATTVLPVVQQDVAQTQQINADATSCRWCSGRLIWHEAPGTAQHGWIHRHTYQATCSMPDNDTGAHMLAEPA